MATSHRFTVLDTVPDFTPVRGNDPERDAALTALIRGKVVVLPDDSMRDKWDALLRSGYRRKTGHVLRIRKDAEGKVYYIPTDEQPTSRRRKTE